MGHWEGHRRPWWGKSTDFLRASSSQGTFLPHLSKDSDSLGNNRKRKKDSNGRGRCRLAQEEHSRKPSVHFLHLFSSSPHMASLTSSHHQPSSAKRGEGPAPPVLQETLKQCPWKFTQDLGQYIQNVVRCPPRAGELILKGCHYLTGLRVSKCCSVSHSPLPTTTGQSTSLEETVVLLNLSHPENGSPKSTEQPKGSTMF